MEDNVGYEHSDDFGYGLLVYFTPYKCQRLEIFGGMKQFLNKRF